MFDRLKRFEVFIIADEDTINQILMDVRSINHIYYYAKQDNLLFKGCRRNWFPLFLACRGIIRHGNKNDMSRIEIASLLKLLGNRPEYHSFYIDEYYWDCTNRSKLKLTYRARENCEDILFKIFAFYGKKIRIATREEDKTELRMYRKLGQCKIEV